MIDWEKSGHHDVGQWVESIASSYHDNVKEDKLLDMLNDPSVFVRERQRLAKHHNHEVPAMALMAAIYLALSLKRF